MKSLTRFTAASIVLLAAGMTMAKSGWVAVSGSDLGLAIEFVEASEDADSDDVDLDMALPCEGASLNAPAGEFPATLEREDVSQSLAVGCRFLRGPPRG